MIFEGLPLCMKTMSVYYTTEIYSTAIQFVTTKVTAELSSSVFDVTTSLQRRTVTLVV